MTFQHNNVYVGLYGRRGIRYFYIENQVPFNEAFFSFVFVLPNSV